MDDIILKYISESDMFDELRIEWNKINKVDPSSKTYKDMIKYLDKLNKNQLKKLSTANIKFVSQLAKNRL